MSKAGSEHHDGISMVRQGGVIQCPATYRKRLLIGYSSVSDRLHKLKDSLQLKVTGGKSDQSALRALPLAGAQRGFHQMTAVPCNCRWSMLTLPGLTSTVATRMKRPLCCGHKMNWLRSGLKQARKPSVLFSHLRLGCSAANGVRNHTDEWCP